MLDPLLAPERLLYRLFHEEQVRVFRAISLKTYCSCSRDTRRGHAAALLRRGYGDMVVDGELWVSANSATLATISIRKSL